MITLKIRLFGPQHTDWTIEQAVAHISQPFPDRAPLSPLSFDPETNVVRITLNQEKLSDVQTDWLHLSDIASAIDTCEVEPVPEHTLTLTGDQAKAIARILQAKPILTYEDGYHGGDAAYALASSEYAEAIIAGFGKHSDQSITRAFLDDDGKIQVERVRMMSLGACSSSQIMDNLCAAWIAFRTKYLVPQEPKKQTEDGLACRPEHPF